MIKNSFSNTITSVLTVAVPLGGKLTINYPADRAANAYASSGHMLSVNNDINQTYVIDDNKLSIEFGANSAVITNRTGFPWAIGDKIAVTLKTRSLNTVFVGDNNGALNTNQGNRLGAIGDSITAYTIYSVASPPHTGYSSNGNIAGLQNYWGHRFYIDPQYIKGIGGQSTTQMLARFDTDIVANYANIDWLSIQGGTNDALFGILPAVTVNNIITMAEHATDNGIRVFIWGPMPRNDGSASTTILKRLNQQRSMLLDYCARTNRPIYFIDLWPDFIDPTSATGAPMATPIPLLADGLHLSSGGSISYAGRRAADTLSPYVKARPYLQGGAMDVYDVNTNPYGNLLPNSVFATTTGGTLSQGTGPVPASWRLARRAGTMANADFVISNVAGVGGYDSLCTPKTKIAVNIPGTNTATETIGFLINAQVTTNIAAGDKIICGCVVELDTVANLKQLVLSCADNGSDLNYQYSDGFQSISSNNFLAPITQKIFLETPAFILRPTTTGISWEAQASFKCDALAGTANIQFSSPYMRKVAY